MLKAAIVGATGYTGEELIKILLRHNKIKITDLSRYSADKEEPISNTFPSLRGRMDLPCMAIAPERISRNADIIFLALPHKASMDYAPAFLKAGRIVIDLSADYRLPADIYAKWYGVEHKDAANLPKAVYGLPELYRDKIRDAKFIANPGCYPTSINLAIAPLVKAGIVDPVYIISDSKSGTSGAGKKADVALSFTEVDGNLKAYKVNDHQHKPEINRIVSDQAGRDVDVVFTPHLISMPRGILSTIYFRLVKGIDTGGVLEIYRAFYKGKPFVRISPEGEMPEVKHVVNTNFCDIGAKVTGDKLIAVSCIDNLIKGASGQAVQNMNLICGFDETEGLI